MADDGNPSVSILIVEDEGIIAENLREILNGFGYRVVAVAATIEQALARVGEQNPEVILMDIRLKGNQDGIAGAEVLKQSLDVPASFSVVAA